MKILGSVITKCNNKHFDLVVHLRYRSWWFGSTQTKTVFRHRHERFTCDVTSFAVWYDSASGVRLKDSWCYALDHHV